MTRVSSILPRLGDGGSNQALAHSELDRSHLAQQRLDIVNGDDRGAGGCHDDADAPNDRNTALAGNSAPSMLVQKEARTKLGSESDRLRLSRIEPVDTAEFCNYFSVAWSLHAQPGGLSQIDGSRAAGRNFGMDGRRDTDVGEERRKDLEPPNAGEDDERAGVRDDQRVDRSFFGMANWTCWRSSSSDRSR